MEGFTFYTSSSYRSTLVDLIPRLLSLSLFSKISSYLVVRNYVLNRFIKEVYEERSLPIPEWIIKTTPYYRPEMV